jgi:hypothetical protein
MVCCGLLLVSNACAAEGDARRMALPAPATTGGKPLLDALAARKTGREFSDKSISEQTLSDLLWATWGVNRKDGRRTAPTANNRQEIQLYAVLESGVWLYDGKENALVRAMSGDLRSTYGSAPLTLLYAAPARDVVSGMHAGALFQNAGLFCASEGLTNTVKTTGKDALKGRLKLPDGYEVLVVQSIGWPR